MKIANAAQTFLATSFHSKGCALILAKTGLGYILGDFFTNLSGHPGNDCSLQPNNPNLRSLYRTP
jgi:hypothetical protein